MKREAAILGMLLATATDGERVEIYAGVRAGLENGSLRPVIGREVPLSEAPAAHRLLMAWSGYGKVVLVP